MHWKEMAKGNEGLHTVETFAGSLGVSRGTAVNYLHALRKHGFAETSRGKNGKRMYDIAPVRLRKIGYPGLHEVLSSGRMKLNAPIEERSDHEICPEEAIVMAVLTQDYRVVMASLEMFKKVEDWWRLYRMAKKHDLERVTGALYTLSRKLFRVRHADKRVLRMMMKSRSRREEVIEGMHGKDFPDIEKKWKVKLPFSRSDLRRLE